MADLHSGERRRHIRYKPGAVSIQDLEVKTREACAHIDLNLTEGVAFEPRRVQVGREAQGFVLEQSKKRWISEPPKAQSCGGGQPCQDWQQPAI